MARLHVDRKCAYCGELLRAGEDAVVVGRAKLVDPARYHTSPGYVIKWRVQFNAASGTKAYHTGCYGLDREGPTPSPEHP